VSPVRYEVGFYIPEDDILHSHRRENLKSYIFRNAFPDLSSCLSTPSLSASKINRLTNKCEEFPSGVRKLTLSSLLCCAVPSGISDSCCPVPDIDPLARSTLCVTFFRLPRALCYTHAAIPRPRPCPSPHHRSARDKLQLPIT
jgi:hypothetical protein